MKFTEAKEKFINTWGSLGTSWGINKAMAQIQALLFISKEPLSVEEIMEQLQISRGNVSMNLRQLIDWKLVSKQYKLGERKDFYTTIKDVEELARVVAQERSRRELAPAIAVLKEVSSIPSDGSDQVEEFIKQTKALHNVSDISVSLLDKLSNQKSSWISKTFVKLFSGKKKE